MAKRATANPKSKTPTNKSEPKEATMSEQTLTPDVQNTTDSDDKERKGKPSFPLDTAVDADGNAIALDPNGRLTAVPHNWTPQYARLRVGDFAPDMDDNGEPIPGTDRAKVHDFNILLKRQRIRLIEEQIRDEEDKKLAVLDPSHISTRQASSALATLARKMDDLRKTLRASGMTDEQIDAMLSGAAS